MGNAFIKQTVLHSTYFWYAYSLLFQVSSWKLMTRLIVAIFLDENGKHWLSDLNFATKRADSPRQGAKLLEPTPLNGDHRAQGTE